VLNVGVALHHLSGGQAGKSLTLSTLGGAAYEPIDREFDAMGVSRRWVRTQAPTRVCTTIVDRESAQATELVENAGPITAAELMEFERAFAAIAAGAGVVVLTGSLPAEAPRDYFLRLLQHVRGKAVLDVRGPELLAALDARLLVVKPNRHELAHTLGKPINTEDDLRHAVTDLQERGAQAVVVTSGKEDVWIGIDGEFLRLTPEPVKSPVNTIGCGDCLAAGIAWALDEGQNITSAVQLGMHCAAKNLQTLLPSDFDGCRESGAYR
jgi:fructose-1-phosphate kinase PfkB-like protein